MKSEEIDRGPVNSPPPKTESLFGFVLKSVLLGLAIQAVWGLSRGLSSSVNKSLYDIGHPMPPGYRPDDWG